MFFSVGNKSHPQSEKIDLFLEDIRKRMKEEGYVLRYIWDLERTEGKAYSSCQEFGSMW